MGMGQNDLEVGNSDPDRVKGTSGMLMWELGGILGSLEESLALLSMVTCLGHAQIPWSI